MLLLLSITNPNTSLKFALHTIPTATILSIYNEQLNILGRCHTQQATRLDRDPHF